jgi:hypothetical protein
MRTLSPIEHDSETGEFRAVAQGYSGDPAFFPLALNAVLVVLFHVFCSGCHFCPYNTATRDWAHSSSGEGFMNRLVKIPKNNPFLSQFLLPALISLGTVVLHDVFYNVPRDRAEQSRQQAKAIYSRVVDFARIRPARAREVLLNIKSYKRMPDSSKSFFQAQWTAYYASVSDWNIRVNSLYDDLELSFGKELADSFGNNKTGASESSLHMNLINTHKRLRILYCKFEIIADCEDIPASLFTLKANAQTLADTMTTTEDAFFDRLKAAYQRL